MKVTQHIENAKGKPLFSFEIVPPQKGTNINDLYVNIDPLMEFKPPFIDVTTSREEYVYIEKDWIFDRRITRMRPGTVGICASIQHRIWCGCHSSRFMWRIYQRRNRVFIGGLPIFGNR